jgi:galactonate dehydratase
MPPGLIGHSASEIRHLGTTLFDEFQTRRGNSDFYCAWSAIEIALWDIVGKYAGLPVYSLLGGCHRKSVRMYANGWSIGAKTIEETVKRALKIREMGFTALKWDPFCGPRRYYISQEEEDFAVNNVKAVREALGPGMDLLIEMGRRLSPYHAIRYIRRIEEYNPYVVEEPCIADNLELVAEVKRNVSSRVVTGETFFTKSEFLPVFENRMADVINPEICACGGILTALQLADMAEPHNICYSPHNCNGSIIALAAALHVCAAAGNFSIAEMFVNMKPGCDLIDLRPLQIKDGYAQLPTEPGLGIDIDIDEMRRHPYHAF